MATPNMFDLLNDDAQDQEIQIPAVKKAAPAPAPKAQPGTPSKPADNRGPRKEGARPPRRDNEDRGGPRGPQNEVSRAPSPEPVEPEAPVKTLDDYLQEKAAKALKIALPATRAANAGADHSQWKNAKVLE
ncbi:hypothetical protein BG000_001770, partial [Podila horticola]